MKFWKYEGLGNDFVLCNVPVSGEQARTLCHRSLGIGADGVLVVSSPEAEPSVKVWNSDGSLAEVCGNGLRCVALHLFDLLGRSSPVHIRSDAGLHLCEQIKDGIIRVEMGSPEMDRPAIPAQGEGPFVDEPLEAAGTTLRFTAVGMGNPHAVTFDPVTEKLVPTLGPAFEHHGLFPARVNVGFATMEGPAIALTVWERGAGLTGACGSGACAAAVAACATGRAEPYEPLMVVQPGGTLTITVGRGKEPILMEGPARRVFAGEVNLPRHQ